MELPNKTAGGAAEKDDHLSSTFEQGLDFLLTHFTEPIFPRKITTTASKNKQFLIYNKQDILNVACEANYIDCRINAYPIYTGYRGAYNQAPNMLFIDIDRNGFKSDVAHNQALQGTLANIRKEFGVEHQQPTVLWSGNGYHIILPIDMPVLKHVNEFEKFEEPSQKFLRYAEDRLSNGNADQEHNPSFKSCLLRIPGSLNKKCIEAGKEGQEAQVRIIQRWNGKRVRPSRQFMDDFYVYLTAEKIKKRKLQMEVEKRFRKNSSRYGSNSRIIPWIETLLETPLEDYRKHTVDLILAAYLMLVHQLTYDEAFRIIEVWLDKCNAVRRLDFDLKDKIKTALKNASKNKIPPMKLETLKQRNPELYCIIARLCDKKYS